MEEEHTPTFYGTAIELEQNGTENVGKGWTPTLHCTPIELEQNGTDADVVDAYSPI